MTELLGISNPWLVIPIADAGKETGWLHGTLHRIVIYHSSKRNGYERVTSREDFLIRLPGFPTYTPSGSVLDMISAPAPIKLRSAMFRPSRISAPNPMKQRSPTVTFPPDESPVCRWQLPPGWIGQNHSLKHLLVGKRVDRYS